jgi:hypothetical protein
VISTEPNEMMPRIKATFARESEMIGAEGVGS